MVPKVRFKKHIPFLESSLVLSGEVATVPRGSEFLHTTSIRRKGGLEVRFTAFAGVAPAGRICVASAGTHWMPWITPCGVW